MKPSTKIYGKKFSSKQPEVNLSLTKGMREEGISLTKMNNVLSGMGVNCSNYRKMIIQDKIMREVIKSFFDVIIHQNRKEHVSACRNASEYKENIIWVDKDGTKHSTAVGTASIDGAGLTRECNQWIRGVQSAFLMIILLNNKPTYLINTQVSCHQCIIRFNKAIEVFGVDSVINNYIMVK